MEAGALQEKLLVAVVHIGADHVGNGEAARIASQKLDGSPAPISPSRVTAR